MNPALASVGCTTTCTNMRPAAAAPDAPSWREVVAPQTEICSSMRPRTLAEPAGLISVQSVSLCLIRKFHRA
jgi:hypothetical protein